MKSNEKMLIVRFLITLVTMILLSGLIMALSIEQVMAADSVSYQYYASDSAAVEGSVSNDTVNTYTTVENSNSTVTWSSDWYVVNKNVTITGRITVSGTVNLILCDNCTLTAKEGITVANGNSNPNTLNIYAQNGGSGKLLAGTDGTDCTCKQHCAGIGGETGDNRNCGNVTIHGGLVEASGNDLVANIGGAYNGSAGRIIINGGTVDVSGSSGRASLGAESRVGDITINGGTVRANHTGYGSCIEAQNIKIAGGTVTAGGYNSVCIYSSGTVEISGGTVYANYDTITGNAIAGSGTGIYSAGRADIKGGTVYACSGALTGIDNGIYAVSEINISGGVVTAFSMKGPAIQTAKVSNAITGIGWADSAGAGDYEEIPVNSTSTDYSKYRRVVFGNNIHHAHDGTFFYEWTDASAAEQYNDNSYKADNCLPKNKGNYYLTKNVDLGSNDWDVPAGITKLCLNGKTITSSERDSTVLLDSNCTLNIYDEHTGDSAGLITNTSGDGIWLKAGSSVLNMYGGKIDADDEGVILHEKSAAHFNMYGGMISGNDYGVIIGESAEFYMSGGVITNNSWAGVRSEGTFKVSGSPRITGNIKSAGTDENVLLSSGNKITVTDALTEGANIGVTLAEPSDSAVFTDGLSGKLPNNKTASDIFTSDNNDYTISTNGSDEAILKKKDPAATPTFSPAGGYYTAAQSVTLSCATAGVTIHYTTNGTDPTTNSTVYSGPISVSSTTTIKAIAVKSGMPNSAVASVTYEIDIDPHGNIEAVAGNAGSIDVSGWAFDPSDISQSIDVHVYIGGEAGADGAEGHAIKADVERPDVDKVYQCGKYHGFSSTITTSKRGSQPVYIYAINTGDGKNVCLGNRTATITDPTPEASYHVHDDITFYEWTDAKAAEQYNDSSKTADNCLPKESGAYCLIKDVTLSDTWNVPDGATDLCLNGHGITLNADTGSVINIGNDHTLTLYDCGTIIHSYEIGEDGLAVVDTELNEDHASFTGGYITGGKGGKPTSFQGITYYYGGGVLNGGTFNMVGGTIIGNTASIGGGVKNSGPLNPGTFNMQGGSIIGNKGSSRGGGVNNGGIINMYGSSSIMKNTSPIGGGVHNYGGEFNMYGNASIAQNTAERGGGVNNKPDNTQGSSLTSSFTIYGSASITDNIASEDGGGVYDDSFSADQKAGINIKGTPKISGNKKINGDDYEDSNVYLLYSQIDITGALSGTGDSRASIWISMRNPGVFSNGFKDKNAETEPKIFFTSDDPNYRVGFDDNNTEACLVAKETVKTPEFSPAGGKCTEVQTVTISCATQGAAIYYTTDGSDPTTGSQIYSKAISVSGTTTIKAFAVKDDMKDSEIASATYNFPCQLVFDHGEGSGTMTSQAVYIGDTFTFPECTFDRPAGKVFDHWKMSGVEGLFYPDKPGNNTVEIAKNCLQSGVITVTAYWRTADPAIINKAPTGNDLTYNGSAQDLVAAGEVEGGTMQYALGNETKATEPYTTSIPTATDAGKYYVWYKVMGDKSHCDIAAACCSAEIKKRTVTLTSESGEKPYDESALTKPDVTGWRQNSEEGFVTGEVSDVKATGTVTTVAEGEVTNTITYKEGEKFKEDNYNIEKTEGKLKITPKAVTVTARDHEFTYNGTAQSWDKYDVDGLVGTDAISAAVTGSITFPDESPVTNRVDSYEFTSGTAGNYSVTTQDGKLTMVNAAAEVTITAASEAWEYDGSPHSNSEVTVTEGALFSGDELTASATGTVTDVADTKEGNNPVAEGYKIMHDEKDVTDSYVITPIAGTLTISKKAAKVTAKDQTIKEGSGIRTGTDQATLTGALDGHKLSEVTLKSDTADKKIIPGAAGIVDADDKDVTGNYDISYTDGTLTVRKAISATVTFKVVSGSWDDGTSSNKTVTLKGYEGDTLKLSSKQIPGVGSKPDEGCEEGSWDAVPVAGTVISRNTTYTYKYEEKKKISANVTFKVVNGSWNVGTGKAAKADKIVTLSGYEGDTLKLSEWQIPGVGMWPNRGYMEGSWDVTPSPETEITQDTTYTYTFAAIPVPTPVEQVAEDIENLPPFEDLTVSDKYDVFKVFDEYEYLTDAEKKEIDPALVDKLMKAYDKIEALIVEDEVSMLPDKVTLKDEYAVNYTVEDYLTLTDSQKEMFSAELLQKLADAENTIITGNAKAKKAKITSVKNRKSRKAVVKWKKVSGAAGYRISYSTSRKFKKNVKTKKAKAKAKSITLKKLKKGKTYYIKVQPYSRVTNRITGETKVVRGKASAMKKVKVKK